MTPEIWNFHVTVALNSNSPLDLICKRLIEKIPKVTETGILSIAFAFVDIVKEYGDPIEEVSIDSICEFTTSL